MIEELQIYPQNELPPHWYYQIMAFLRIHFTEGFVGKMQFRNWISSPEQKPMSLLIGHDDILIAHTQVLTNTLLHHGHSYRIYELSGVMVYPAFQKQGYGRKIVEAGTAYIRAQPDADVGITICGEHNVGFYEKCGWQFVETVLLFGDRENPIKSEERVALSYLSEKAQQHQVDFETIPLFFEDEW